MLDLPLDYFTPSFWRPSLSRLAGQCAPEPPISAFPVLGLQVYAAGPGFLCGCCRSQLISSLHLNNWTISLACCWWFDRQSPLLFLWTTYHLCVDIFGHCLWCWGPSPGQVLYCWVYSPNITPGKCWLIYILPFRFSKKLANYSLRKTGTLSSGMPWKEGQSLGGGCTARKLLGVSSVSEERHRNLTRLIAC